MMLPAVMRAYWIPLLLTIASVKAATVSVPSTPAGGFCQQALQTIEDRLLALQANLAAKSESQQGLQSTLGKVLQLLDIKDPNNPDESGYTVDGLPNATEIEVVTLGPTEDDEGSSGGSGSLGDDEDLDVTYKVDAELDLDATSRGTTSKPLMKAEKREVKPEEIDFSGDDTETKRDVSSVSNDDEDMVTNLEGSGESSGDFIDKIDSRY